MARSLEKVKQTDGLQLDALPSLSLCYLFVGLSHDTLRTHSLPLFTGVSLPTLKTSMKFEQKDSEGKTLNVAHPMRELISNSSFKVLLKIC